MSRHPCIGQIKSTGLLIRQTVALRVKLRQLLFCRGIAVQYPSCAFSIPLEYWLLSKAIGLDHLVVKGASEVLIAGNVGSPCGPSPGRDYWICDCLRVIERDLQSQEGLMYLRLGSSRTSLLCSVVSEIKQIWPEAYQDLITLVQDIVVVDGHGIRSATVPLAFGSVFIGANCFDSPSLILELLIHETAHLALDLQHRFFPLEVGGGSHTLTSPLRQGGRPPMAVMHAAYVSYRVAEVMKRKILTCGPSSEVCNTLEQSISDLSEALAAINGLNCWTVSGRTLLEDLKLYLSSILLFRC
jgi:hypothetical protein